MKIRNKKILSVLSGAVMCTGLLSAFPVMADDDMVIAGDFNNDGAVNAIDATEILQYYADISTGVENYWSEEKKRSADINGDGEILATDATWVLMYYAYLSTGDGDKIGDIRTYADCITKLDNIDFGLDLPDLHATQSFDETTNELSLSWKPVEDISGYKFEFYSPEGKTEEILNDTEYKITLGENIMTSDNTYSYKITPYVDIYDLHGEPDNWINEKVNPT